MRRGAGFRHRTYCIATVRSMAGHFFGLEHSKVRSKVNRKR